MGIKKIKVEVVEMTGIEYQTLAMRTANKWSDKQKQTLEGCLGLVGETGEVVDLIKKHIYQGHSLNVTEFKKELGDVLWYVSYLADTYGLTLDDVMETNIKKLERRYPRGFEVNASVHREE